jgi:hypothetical protein
LKLIFLSSLAIQPATGSAAPPATPDTEAGLSRRRRGAAATISKKKNVNKQPSKSDRLPLIDELSLITKANGDDGAAAAAAAAAVHAVWPVA